jgi:hypothetical protein
VRGLAALGQELGERADDPSAGGGSDDPATFSRERSTEPTALSRPSRSRAKSVSSSAASVASTVEAKASWISTKSKSSSVRPVRSSSRGMAKAPPMSSPSVPSTKDTAPGWASITCARGCRPRSAAHSSEARRTAEAPSDSGVELPAVIVGSGEPSERFFVPKTGFSLASFSSEVSARSDSSTESPCSGVIRSSKNPRS